MQTNLKMVVARLNLTVVGFKLAILGGFIFTLEPAYR